MKISKLFHWLYASLCFLPLLVAPIFALAVRSDNNFEPISVQVEENKIVDFNQYRVNSLSNGSFTPTAQYQQFDSNTVPLNYGHTYYVSLYIKSSTINNIWFRLGSPSQSEFLLNLSNIPTDYQFYSYSAVLNYRNNGNNSAYFQQPTTTFSTFDYKDLMVIDLTQMFGAGNEPTPSEFRDIFPNTYYDYTASTHVLVPNQVVTYNDTDVGSQYLYTLYNVTDKYMDFDNVFNLYQVNEWINVNVFNGSVPLVWNIIWHYLDYWLLLSIFWLCFDVLIYVPQLAHRWLDKAALE